MAAGDDEIRIGPFACEDQEPVRALILAGLAEHWGAVDPSLNPDLEDIATSYADAAVLVARSDAGKVVGTGTLVARGDGAGEIVRMSVARGQRGRGLGRRLTEALRGEARLRGMQRLVLETHAEWTGVVAFYEACGFRRTGTRPGPFGPETWLETTP